MKAIYFPQANIKIAENQPEFEVLPAFVEDIPGSHGNCRSVTVCFELETDEIRQIRETRQIWLTVLQPTDSAFHPIKMDINNPFIDIESRTANKLIKLPKPVGHFITKNAKGIELLDGVYFHYSDVCSLLKKYAKLCHCTVEETTGWIEETPGGKRLCNICGKEVEE